jgi:uncharacterized membrane protein YqgA involved in biofilm formation
LAVLLIGIALVAGSVVGIVFRERITNLQGPASERSRSQLTQGRVVSGFVILLLFGVLCGAAALNR